MIFSGENGDSISGNDFFRGFIDGSERRFFRKAVVLIRTLDAYKIFCSAEKRKNKGKRKKKNVFQFHEVSLMIMKMTQIIQLCYTISPEREFAKSGNEKFPDFSQGGK